MSMASAMKLFLFVFYFILFCVFLLLDPHRHYPKCIAPAMTTIAANDFRKMTISTVLPFSTGGSSSGWNTPNWESFRNQEWLLDPWASLGAVWMIQNWAWWPTAARRYDRCGLWMTRTIWIGRHFRGPWARCCWIIILRALRARLSTGRASLSLAATLWVVAEW